MIYAFEQKRCCIHKYSKDLKLFFFDKEEVLKFSSSVVELAFVVEFLTPTDSKLEVLRILS